MLKFEHIKIIFNQTDKEIVKVIIQLLDRALKDIHANFQTTTSKSVAQERLFVPENVQQR